MSTRSSTHIVYCERSVWTRKMQASTDNAESEEEKTKNNEVQTCGIAVNLQTSVWRKWKVSFPFRSLLSMPSSYRTYLEFNSNDAQRGRKSIKVSVSSPLLIVVHNCGHAAAVNSERNRIGIRNTYILHSPKTAANLAQHVWTACN